MSDTPITSYQYPEAKRKNLPPSGLATKNVVQDTAPHELAYDPHLTPVLRFDSSSGTDELTARVESILEKAKTEPLTPEETDFLATALRRSRQPWLEWAGKREKRAFSVDPVRLSREEAMSYYRHEVDWENRLILGDSLQVMTSLAQREGLAGQVQMIYIDPPYGIKFSSNWQNEVGKRDVKDKDEDLTREPEMIKAYRDTWTLGVHSYLDYLKQRLIAARELLTDSGSVFVQISDENLHRVRAVMDEGFGSENFITQSSSFLSTTQDYLLWFGKNRSQTTYNQLYTLKEPGEEGAQEYNKYAASNGELRPASEEETASLGDLRIGEGLFATYSLFSAGEAENGLKSFNLGTGKAPIRIPCPAGYHFKTSEDGLVRWRKAERILPQVGQRILVGYTWRTWNGICRSNRS